MHRHLLFLPHPKANSHKGQNGVILIIGGSRTYHGAPILSALAAHRFCDLVYFFSTRENMAIVEKMRLSTPNVICVGKKKFDFALSHSDCVLVGNGMDVGVETKRIVEKVLRTKKRCVIDAAALRCLPLHLIHKNVILAPHAGEFSAAFDLAANEKNAVRISKKYCCTIILKGKKDIITSCGKVLKVSGGSAGMTKGGTGDVLAGLLAALFSQCPSPLRAAYSASFLNKKAGMLLQRAFGPNFSSEDLAGELAYAAHSLY